MFRGLDGRIETSSGRGLSRRRKRISGLEFMSFTQSSWKNSVRDGGVAGVGGIEAVGEGTMRMMRATAALRGSETKSERGRCLYELTYELGERQ